MFGAIINNLISKQERALGVSLKYLREMAARSKAAVAKIGLMGPISSHRRHLSKEAWHLARIAATRAEDCGDCTQIVINLAINDGVSPALIKAGLSDDPNLLPMDLALTIRFADDIARGLDNDYLRARLIKIYGPAAFDELAIAIAAARFFPTLKRGLGHSKACRLVEIEHETEMLQPA